MKKNLAILAAALVLLLALAGCGGDPKPTDGPKNDGAATSQPTVEPTEEPAGDNNHVVDYKLDIPDGFEEVELDGVTKCWMNAADNSNINLLISDKEAGADLGFQLLSADLLRTSVEEQMNQAYGTEVTINDRYFTKDKVSGLEAYQYSYELDLNGTKMTQIIVCINADKLYNFTYTTSDADTLTLFEASSKNIELIFG